VRILRLFLDDHLAAFGACLIVAGLGLYVAGYLTWAI
jgi:hypothetical protein